MNNENDMSMNLPPLSECPICGSKNLKVITLKKGLIFKKEILYLICNHCNAQIRIISPDKVKIEKFDIEKYWYMKPLLGKSFSLNELTETSLYYKVYGYIIMKLSSGDFSEVLIESEQSPPVLLRKGEKVLIYIDNVSYHEPRKYTVRVYGGSSHKISNGWWSRSGISYPIQLEELRLVDKGFFVVTNKRVIFGGHKRSITIPVSKISYVLPQNKDSILIGKDSRQKPYYFSGLNKEKLKVSIENKM